MKHILVPTDFSTNAEHAIKYAVIIGKKFKAKITLLHAWMPDADQIVAWTNGEAEFVFKNKIEKKLLVLCAKYNKLYKLEFDFVARQANLTKFINETARKMKVDLVVMGTKGSGKIKNRIFGSNAARMIEKAPCPLIVVPAKAELKAPRKIIFATDYYKNDLRNIKSLVKFGTNFHANIDVLHVSEPFDADTEKLFLQPFAKQVVKSTGYKKLSFKVVTGTNVTTTLENYAKVHKANMLAMVTAQRTLFERLFVWSTTKKMSYHSRYPIFIFHQD